MRVLEKFKDVEIAEEDSIGWGVRATSDIPRGTIIEAVPFVLFPRYTSLGKNLYDMLNQTNYLSEEEKYLENLRANLGWKLPEAYFFKWMPDVPLNGKQHPFCVLPAGNSWLYNSSNTSNNIGWIVKDDLFIFRAERDIKAGEFLRSFFGYFLGEEGQIFPCVQTFGLGLDHFENGRIRCKAIRFGSMEEYEASKTNQAMQRAMQIFQISKDNGFSITKITAMIQNGEEKAAFDVPEGLSLTFLYNKITEFNNSQFPFIKFTVIYETKDGQNMAEAIVFRK